MKLQDCSACAMQEIGDLSSDQSALDTLTKFCTQNLGANRPTFKGHVAAAGSLYQFYVFSAAVSLSGKTPHTDYGKKARFYAREFAELIRELKLGTVWDSPVIQNTIFHKDHANQMHVWMPDRDAIVAWWSKQPKPKTVRPTLPGTWQIGILVKAKGIECVGPNVGDKYYGCGMAFQDGDPVYYQINSSYPRHHLCRICADITEEEEQKAPKIVVKHGWVLETVVPGGVLVGWVCSNSRDIPGKERIAGCSKSITKVGPVYSYYTNGSLEGSILCSACCGKHGLGG